MALSARQNLLARSYLAIVAKLGLWPRDATNEGAYYLDASMNGAKEKGVACRNCVFWKAPNKCTIVKGTIEPNGICRLSVIDSDRLRGQPLVTLRGQGRISGSIG